MSKSAAELEWAMRALWQGTIMLKKRGMPLWHIIRKVADMYHDPVNTGPTGKHE